MNKTILLGLALVASVSAANAYHADKYDGQFGMSLAGAYGCLLYTSCGPIGFEYHHIDKLEIRAWIEEKIKLRANGVDYGPEVRRDGVGGGVRAVPCVCFFLRSVAAPQFIAFKPCLLYTSRCV